jgi:hypothetical protein
VSDRERRRPEHNNTPKPPVPPAYGLQSPLFNSQDSVLLPRRRGTTAGEMAPIRRPPHLLALPLLLLLLAQVTPDLRRYPDPLAGSDHSVGSRWCLIFPPSCPLVAAGAVPGGGRVHAGDPCAQDRRLGRVLGVLALQPQGQEQVLDRVRHPHRSASFDFLFVFIIVVWDPCSYFAFCC